MQSISVFVMVYGQEVYDVAVRDVVHIFHIFDELVAVLHDHEFVAAHEPLLLVLDLASDACVVPVRAFVRPAQNDGLVLPVSVVGVCQCLYEFSAVNSLNISESVSAKFEIFDREKCASGFVIFRDYCT